MSSVSILFFPPFCFRTTSALTLVERDINNSMSWKRRRKWVRERERENKRLWWESYRQTNRGERKRQTRSGNETRKKKQNRKRLAPVLTVGSRLVNFVVIFFGWLLLLLLAAFAEEIGRPVDQVEKGKHYWKDDTRNDVDTLGTRREFRDPRSPTVWIVVDGRTSNAQMKVVRRMLRACFVQRNTVTSQSRQRLLKRIAIIWLAVKTIGFPANTSNRFLIRRKVRRCDEKM